MSLSACITVKKFAHKNYTILGVCASLARLNISVQAVFVCRVHGGERVAPVRPLECIRMRALGLGFLTSRCFQAALRCCLQKLDEPTRRINGEGSLAE